MKYDSDLLSMIDEINFATAKMELAAQELKEARSSLGLAGEVKEMMAVLKIVAFAMLSDEDTKQQIKEIAKIAKDKNILDFVKKFDNF
ncbi:hypothetical protein [Sulfurospirillum sp. 1612]|uniref:hypothetical protein n=1 Tax=Sulfurospirillum sp. 1612 TaxID=3094835 RepID=UPI002F91C06A